MRLQHASNLVDLGPGARREPSIKGSLSHPSAKIGACSQVARTQLINWVGGKVDKLFDTEMLKGICFRGARGERTGCSAAEANPAQ